MKRSDLTGIWSSAASAVGSGSYGKLSMTVCVRLPCLRRRPAFRVRWCNNWRDNLRVGVMLTVFTLLVWSLGLVGVCVMAGGIVYTNLERLEETGLFLSEAWAVAGVVGQSLWDVIVELTATSTALGVASTYLVLVVAALAVWCIIIQRTTQPLRTRALEE